MSHAQFSLGIALTSALWTRWECETDLWWLNWQQQNLRFLSCEKHLYTAPPARVCNQESRIHGQPPPCSLPSTHPPKCSQRLIKWGWEIFFFFKSALMLISKAEEWSDKRTMDRAGSHTRKGNDCVMVMVRHFHLQVPGSFFVLVPAFLRSLHYVSLLGYGHLSPFQPH